MSRRTMRMLGIDPGKVEDPITALRISQAFAARADELLREAAQPWSRADEAVLEWRRKSWGAQVDVRCPGDQIRRFKAQRKRWDGIKGSPPQQIEVELLAFPASAEGASPLLAELGEDDLPDRIVLHDTSTGWPVAYGVLDYGDEAREGELLLEVQLDQRELDQLNEPATWETDEQMAAQDEFDRGHEPPTQPR